MRTRRTRYINNDAVPLAGWVFADLLLSLSIIFLTSISFDLPGAGPSSSSSTDSPNVSRQETASNQGIVNPSSKDIIEPISTGFSKIYLRFNEKSLKNDIENYRKKNGLTENDRIVFAQIIGGYDSSSETSDTGSIRATAFIVALHKANMSEFDSAGIHISTSDRIPSGQVMIRMSLARYFD